ncbi:arylamine N-acetyltransferase [Salipiger sp. H15]|uniref:Arylamine N-acetyltransferase n=1 Tax=Alloyangia sp. H15 TaxID=3029062 RepID=A0AAU8AM69_9RHOB
MTQMTPIRDDYTLSQSQIDTYLARIGMARPVQADLQSLTQLHRAHLLTFPFEALDAFMGWPSGFTPAAAFDKMVLQRRGGWCFEMNGLFGAVLQGLGFRVTRLCGGVHREMLGDMAVGNHLTLRVDLDRPYLAEVGVADAIFEPVPLALGPIRQRGFDFEITEADGGWLRFNNHPQGIARSFDFRPDHADEEAMTAAHAWLMQDPGSPFTNALAVMRHTEDGYVALQNDQLRRVTSGKVFEGQVTGAAHLAEILETVFDLDVPKPEDIWARVQSRVRSEAA